MSDYLLSVSQKKEILSKMAEIDMHKELVILFEKMYDDKTKVHYTHGPNEFGRDIIISRHDPIKPYNTALVIKMDKLSGSNMDKGILDIAGQVQQCFTIDIKAKDSFNKMPIDAVYIIVFGEISNNAVENLDSKIHMYKDRCTKFDINQMLELFDKYYPEIFYGASGLHVLNKKYQELEKALKEKKYYNPECFIEPNLKSFNKSKQEMVSISSSNDKKVAAETMGNNIFGKKETISSIAHKVSTMPHTILVEGDAGSGKSIFSSKLTQFLIHEAVKGLEVSRKKEKKVKLPVLIKATNLKNGKCNNLEVLMDSYYDESTIESDINLLLIDGLDEVDDVSKENIINVASKICHDRHMSLIFTTRKSNITRKLVESFENFELVPFETSQAINFIKKMVTSNQALLTALLKGLDQLKNQIPMYPMALSLLIEIVEEQGEVPASITELYQQYIEISLGKYSATSDITVLFEPTVKYKFLQSLSYELFYKNNVSFVSLEEFDNFVKEYAAEHSAIHDIEKFKYDLSRVSIFQLKVEHVEFSHKSFLDYFISSYFSSNALSLFKSDAFDDIYKCYHTTLWEDVTSFYFGIKKEIEKEDIKKLIDSDPKNNELLSAVHRFGIGNLMQYAWNSKKDIKHYAIRTGVSGIFHLKDLLYDSQKEMFEMELPKIVSDVTLIHLIGENYSSTFLEKELKDVVNMSVKNIMSDKANQNDIEMFYFGSLYLVSNSKSLSLEYVQEFITGFIEIEKKLDTKVSLPVVALLRTLTNSIDIEDDKKDKEYFKNSLSIIQSKLIKKFKKYSAEIFSFKNKRDKMQLNDIVKGKRSKR